VSEVRTRRGNKTALSGQWWLQLEILPRHTREHSTRRGKVAASSSSDGFSLFLYLSVVTFLLLLGDDMMILILLVVSSAKAIDCAQRNPSARWGVFRLFC